MLLKKLALGLFKKSIDLTVVNAISPKTPVVYICNHTSFADGAILASCLDNPVFVVHKDLARSKRYTSVLKFIDHVLVSPDNPMAVRQVFRYIKQDRNVVVFPEGRLTVTGSLMKVYPGAAYLALKAQVPIIPLHIDGLVASIYSKLKGDKPKKIRPCITLLYGEPIAPVKDFSKRKHLIQSTQMLKQQMTSLAFQALNRVDSLHEGLLNAIKRFSGARPALEELNLDTVSYSKFYLMSQGLGFYLQKLVSSSTFGVFMPNASASAALLFASSIVNKTPAMLNYSMGKDPFISCLKTAKISEVVTSRKFIEVGGLQRFVGYMQEANVKVIYLEDIKARAQTQDKLKILFRSFCKYEAPKAQDRNVILFTSGSEGLPKGVVLSHKAILSNVSQIRAIVDISVNDKIFNAMPLFHSFGLTAGTILPLMTGAKLVLYPSPLHYKKIPEFVYDKDCTVLFGTNTFLSKYAKEANPYDFFRLRYVVAGAEKVLDSTRNTWFEKFGIRIFEGYGATECAPVLCVNTPGANKFGTVGKFLPHISYILEPVPGVDAAINCKAGKLIVAGPNMYSAYLRPNKTPSLEIAGSQYDTGDIVEIDEDGFVKILGRAKRFVKIAGEMVSLESIEKTAALCSTQLCAAVGISTKEGERVVLYTQDIELTKEKINSVIASQGLSKLWSPFKLEFLADVPLLGTGKTDYQTLTQLAKKYE